MLIDVLEGLHKAKSLIDVATDGGVIESGLHKHTLGVDDVETTVGVASLLNQTAVLARNGLGEIGHKGDLKSTAETTLLAGGVDPGQVGVLGINRHADHLTEKARTTNRAQR
jgi:hypothetical protein